MPYNNSIFALLINVYSNKGFNTVSINKKIIQLWGIKKFKSLLFRKIH